MRLFVPNTGPAATVTLATTSTATAATSTASTTATAAVAATLSVPGRLFLGLLVEHERGRRLY
jgi:hypothetical protein